MGRLIEEQKQFYKKNGYLVLKGLVPAEELEAISVEYDKLFRRKNQEKMESSWVGSDENDRKNDSEYTVGYLNTCVNYAKLTIPDIFRKIFLTTLSRCYRFVEVFK